MKEKKPAVPSIINITRHYQDYIYWFNAWGYQDPILYKDDELPYSGIVFVILTRKKYGRDATDSPVSEEREAYARQCQKYTFKEFKSGLKKYITCKFQIILLEDMPDAFVQRFRSPCSWGIRLTQEMSSQQLERELVLLFGRTWVYGSEPWIVKEKEKLSRRTAWSKKQLGKTMALASSYLKLHAALVFIQQEEPRILVTTLTISEIDFADSLYLLLNNFLIHTRTLRHIYLKPSNDMGFGQTATFLNALRENTSLLSVHLGSANKLEVEPTALQGMVKTNTTLQTLSLWRYSTAVPICRLFADCLAFTQTLSSLQLKRSPLEKNEMDRLVKSLAHNRSITALTLSHAYLTPNQLQKIMLLIERAENPLQSLNLSGNTIPRRTAYFLSQILQKNPLLHTLKIKGCDIPTKGLKRIFRALWENTHLRTLEFNRVIEHDSSLPHLYELFQHNTSISHLGVSSHMVDLHEFLSWLLSTSSLRSLNLRGCHLQSWAFKAIASTLSHNRTLTSLCLGYTWENEWAYESKTLAKALKNNTTLTTLKFEGLKFIKHDLTLLTSLIARNKEAHRQTQKLFIYYLILLELKISEWIKVPLDIKLYFLTFIGFSENTFVKNKEQMRECVKFLASHREKCQELITAKQAIVLFEKHEQKEAKDSYRFRFFSATEFPLATIGIKLQKNTAPTPFLRVAK